MTIIINTGDLCRRLSLPRFVIKVKQLGCLFGTDAQGLSLKPLRPQSRTLVHSEVVPSPTLYPRSHTPETASPTQDSFAACASFSRLQKPITFHPRSYPSGQARSSVAPGLVSRRFRCDAK